MYLSCVHVHVTCELTRYMYLRFGGNSASMGSTEKSRPQDHARFSRFWEKACAESLFTYVCGLT